MICAKLTYQGQTMQADLWYHRTAPENVKTDAEIKDFGPLRMMGEPMVFVRALRLKTICAQCREEGYGWESNA